MNNTHDNSIDYSHITDGIFVGTNQCCKTHFDEALTRDGINADISLEKNRLDAPFGVDFYAWIPVEDHNAPTPDQLELGVDVLNKLVKMKKKVYVHCKNGHGRAPTLVAAYLVKKGKAPDEAIGLIKSKRPSIHLTDEQIKSLKIWEHKLKT